MRDMGLLQDLISKVGLDTSDFDKKLDKMSKDLRRSGRRWSLIGNDLTQNLTLPMAALGGFALKSAADIEKLEKALKNTMGAEYMNELERLREIAKDPGLGFEQAIKGSVALQAVGVSADDSRKILQEWGNAVAASGGTAIELNRVITQLQQAMAKQGSLLREDWKFIVQAAPAVNKAMMQAYGTVDLEELRARGITAKEAIMGITEELTTFSRVQGGIANQFINFFDSMKIRFAEFGKVLFEQANLANLMDALLGVTERLFKAFGNLNPEMQRFAVYAGIGLAALGPMVRLFGSLQLVSGVMLSFFSNLGKQIGITAMSLGSLRKGWISFEVMMLNSNKKIIRSLGVLADYMTGVVAAIPYAVIGAQFAKSFYDSFARKMGEYAANNPNSWQSRFLDAGFFTQFGTSASNSWVEGFATQMSKNQKKMEEGFEKAFDTLNITGGLEKWQSTPGNEMLFDDDYTPPAGLSEWGKAMQGLSKELGALNEEEKLWGKNLSEEKRSAVYDTIAEAFRKFGMSAGDPRIEGLLDRLKGIRGAVQGVVAEIPKLNKLPDALSPTGGVPSAGAINLDRIFGDQQIWNERTMWNRGLMAVKNLSNGLKEGLMTEQQAVMSLYNDFGAAMGKQLAEGLDNGMVMQGSRLMQSMNTLVEDMKMGFVAGISESIGAALGGENPIKAFAEGLIIPLTDVLAQFGKLLIAAGTARESLKALALTGAGAIVAGGGLIAASGAIKAFMRKRMTSLAEGGIATRPIPAIVGDNPRSPEAIIPLHKLENMLNKGSGAMVRIVGNFDVDMDKLTYSFDEAVDLRRSLSMY